MNDALLQSAGWHVAFDEIRMIPCRRPEHDFHQHKGADSRTKRLDPMPSRAPRRHEAHGAVDFGQRLGAESVSLPLWFTYFLMRCEPFPTPHQATKASDDPNCKASDAPRKDPQQNEWNQQEAPPCHPEYPIAAADHRGSSDPAWGRPRRTRAAASGGYL